MKPLAMWHLLFVRNWHRNVYMQHIPDCIMAHGNRCAHLAWKLWPGDKDLFIACAAHDTGEGGPGDGPYDAKRADPEFKAMMDRKEAEHLAAIGFGDITGLDDPRVKLMDRLDRYLMVRTHRPDLMETPEWLTARQEIWALAQDMPATVRDQVREMLGGMARA